MLAVAEVQEKCALRYELTTSFCKTDGAEGAQVYGFRVAHPDQDGYVAEFRDISPNREAVEELILRFEKGQVQPDQMPYIVEDYIAQL